MATSIVEIPPLSINDIDGSGYAWTTSTTCKTIRQFRLTLDGVTVELSSLGASVTKVLLPRDLPRGEGENHDDASPPPSAEATDDHRDDVVLSYTSPEHQLRDRNRPFFGAIVGRVANRIGNGRFRLGPETYELERNDGPNHLHGGSDGFWNRTWNASVVDDGAGVRFALVSPDGDQGYPGGVEVSASYALVRVRGGACGAGRASSVRGIAGGDGDAPPAPTGVGLRLVMRANLLPGETRATPICLAGHSYFNLAGHSSPCRILDHVLRLPNCEKYTPLDGTSVPTREVRSVDRDDDDDDGGAMDFREGRDLAYALSRYGTEKVGLDRAESARAVSGPQGACDYRYVARVPECGGGPGTNLVGNAPYGFDHNYVIRNKEGGNDEGGTMRLAAVLSHPPTRRSLRVYTTAPGLQVYTSNHLDGNTPSPALCKDGSRYRQWQGICLETQTYPDSIFPDEVDARGDDNDDEFARGRCFVLRPGGGRYYHAVDYEFLMAVDFDTDLFSD
jgi:aldose 1-epimerase